MAMDADNLIHGGNAMIEIRQWEDDQAQRRNGPLEHGDHVSISVLRIATRVSVVMNETTTPP